MTKVAHIYIVRHGETDANREGIIQGQLDYTLNEKGIIQARGLGRAFAQTSFDFAYSSDLQRASVTAKHALIHQQDLEIRTSEALRERFLGPFQGKPASALNARGAGRLIESSGAFATRALTWWDNMLMENGLARKTSSNRPKHNTIAAGAVHATPPPSDVSGVAHFVPAVSESNILVVTHGGFITTLVRNLIEKGQVKCARGVAIGKCYNCSVTIIRVEEGWQLKTVVEQFGDVSHLMESETSTLPNNNADIVR